LAPLIAICTFVHGVWYLLDAAVGGVFSSPANFVLGLMLMAGWVAGVFLGASLTGHPLIPFTRLS